MNNLGWLVLELESFESVINDYILVNPKFFFNNDFKFHFLNGVVDVIIIFASY